MAQRVGALGRASRCSLCAGRARRPPAAAAHQRQQFRAGVDLVHLPVVVTGRDGMLRARADGRRLRGPRGRQAADDRVLRRRRAGRGAAAASRAAARHAAAAWSGTCARRPTPRSSSSTRSTRRVDVTFVDFDTNDPRRPLLAAELSAALRAHPRAEGRAASRRSTTRSASTSRQRSSADGQHVLLLYTDGGDSTSRIDASASCSDLLRLGNVIVYAIGYLENQLSSSARMPQQLRLTQIARETGGEAFFPTSPKELARGLRQDPRRTRLALHARLRVQSSRRATASSARSRSSSRRRTCSGAKVRTRIRLPRPPSSDPAR